MFEMYVFAILYKINWTISVALVLILLKICCNGCNNHCIYVEYCIFLVCASTIVVLLPLSYRLTFPLSNVEEPWHACN